MSYIDKLINNCILAKNAKPVECFELTNIEQLAGIKMAIYIIEEIDGDKQKTFNDFSCYKKTKARSCSKLNSPSSIMYVGSSTTGVKKRIEQHLGLGSKSTYSLHLNEWFNGDYKITIKVYDESSNVMQIIEDDLSDRLKPAFGKQGGNNK